MITTSKILKQFRIDRGYSQEQIAQTIGVSRPTYSAIELGKQNLDIAQAQQLANFYSVGLDVLLSGMIPDLEKYKHMILTFLRMNLSNDGKIPKTKLAKLLYLADFAWYYEHFSSISGLQYRRIQYGPVPDAFFRCLDELQESGKICIEQKKNDNGTVFLISESETNANEKITTLSKNEITMMKSIGKKWKTKTTTDIVNFTHNQLPYTICRENELIPYELITQEDPAMVY